MGTFLMSYKGTFSQSRDSSMMDGSPEDISFVSGVRSPLLIFGHTSRFRQTWTGNIRNKFDRIPHPDRGGVEPAGGHFEDGAGPGAAQDHSPWGHVRD